MKYSNILNIASVLATGLPLVKYTNEYGTQMSEDDVRNLTYDRMKFFYEKLSEEFKDVKDDELPKTVTSTTR